MKFSDLDFQPHPHYIVNGVQAKHFFKNGYGVSVIRSPHSYGGSEGLYELAVLMGDEDVWVITYDTPITEDVLGYLTEEDVEDLLERVARI